MSLFSYWLRGFSDSDYVRKDDDNIQIFDHCHATFTQKL